MTQKQKLLQLLQPCLDRPDRYDAAWRAKLFANLKGAIDIILDLPETELVDLEDSHRLPGQSNEQILKELKAEYRAMKLNQGLHSHSSRSIAMRSELSDTKPRF